VAGDPLAWEHFTQKYSPVLLSAIHGTAKRYSFSLSADDANDIHNRIFLSILEKDYGKLRQFRGYNNCSLSTWLGVAAVRTTINFMKREARLEKGCKEDMREMTAGGSVDFSREMCREEVMKEVRLIIQHGLKPREQLFLRLHFERELEFEEISGMMKLSPNSVYVLKNRLVNKIKKIYRKKYGPAVSK
jgi:RNA polymerase sigma factor (sigma-70 family)